MKKECTGYLQKNAGTKGGLSMRVSAVLCGVLLLPSAVVIAAEAVKSGLQVGERCPPFQVLDITGPNKGKQLCYV